MDVYAKLKELGCELPQPAAKGGLYQPVVVIGDMAYISGQGSSINGEKIVGHVGKDLTVEQGQAAAKACALNALAALNAKIGDLNKVDRLVKTLGFVNAAPGFNQSPAVINGCSQLLMDIWGEEKGLAARSAVPTNELPGDIAVEIEFIFKLK